ncbi:pH-response regulator protein palF/RIM8 [Purpureocillium lilacinum]|uniref:pH-response regulator protein palF/RIM8 n=1 Tax=Purpureocillium lilacinum TaxID=33203 RepID=A0A179HQS4_PURLI|nr:pH-response regulator protein palF/RIM8 [Purpureocillium lilacinum]OAQ91891.1 pH-response regulator protein palF/RIM8 [Purpureocillium lilacinum]
MPSPSPSSPAGRRAQRPGSTRLSTSTSSPDLPVAADAVPRPGDSSPSSSQPNGNGASDSSSSPRHSSSSARPPPPPATPPAARPSLFSRLSLPLPLRNRNRNLVDFHIRCDEPYKKYCAGDSVRGVVVLALVKPLRITHLVVSLHGYVRVLKDPASAAKAHLAPALASNGPSNRPQYHGNGLASLFQDEQVLSGEGRIDTGRYEFGFELVFPDKELPSSIDFERGTISYMITATLTRPTTIAPTTTCDRRVTLSQLIDIGLLPPPRPRAIFLEPISKRSRRKKAAAVEKSTSTISEVNDVASEADSVDRSVAADDTAREGQADHRSQIPSDMRSEISGESGRSASTAVSRLDLAQLSQVGSAMTQAAKQQVVDDKTITATITLIKGGCLPGDSVSVKIMVQHIKRVKSMTGVIVTLFRQGKMDTSPSPAAFRDSGIGESRGGDKDEMYPRSRTGLGGLSLSSTSSTSMFRKDLDQNAAPLIIDPVSLQASVTVSVRVPDDAFPTIKGVPGDMISFKYQVEVVVDLGGRLASQLQGGQSTSRLGPYGYGSSDQASNTYGPRRPVNIADTAQLRREKGVISVSMETVVGSMDSSRIRKPLTRPPETRAIRIAESDDEEVIRPEAPHHDEASPSYFETNGQLPPNGYQTAPRTGQPSYQDATHHGPLSHTNGYHTTAAPSYVPPPEVPSEHGMSEKERIRQAETRLLPSQPPASATAGPSSAPAEDDIYDAEDTPRIQAMEPSAPSNGDAEAGPSAPTEEEMNVTQPAEDKQELERQRLMNEASAPPEFPDDADGRGASSSSQSAPQDAEPSAPVLNEDEDDYPGYGVGAGPSAPRSATSHAEQLPAYER